MTDTPATRYCPNCGQGTFPGRYCSACGASLPADFNGADPTAPTTSASAPADPAPQPVADHVQRRPSGRLLVVGIVAAVMAVGAVVVLATRGGNQPTVHGSLTLAGGGGYTTESPCVGTSNGIVDYSDLRSNTPIKILDASGTILGTDTLGDGEYVKSSAFNGTCKFVFDIPLDTSSNHYQIVIGTRPPYDFTDPNALDLSLGGPR